MHSNTQQLFRIGLLGGIIFLNGCAASHQSPDIYSSNGKHAVPVEDMNARPQHPQPAPGPAIPTRPNAPTQNAENPAVAGLLQQAAQARAQGDFARAQTLAERAQTLAPHEAQSYLELSRIYQERGDMARSRQMALRGLSVVNNDPQTEYALQLLSTP
jgi:hypothetical protein